MSLESPSKYTYPSMNKRLGNFSLNVEQGTFKQGEIVVMLGQNGTGKTTLIKLLGGMLKPDGKKVDMPKLKISYKTQTIEPKFKGTVKELFANKIPNTNGVFKTEVFEALGMDELLD